MTKCKHWDCGFCYAPSDVKTNATQSGCFEPEHCPYLKSQNQMTNETDISKVLIEGEYATIMGVKYKRVEEPKPGTLYNVLRHGLECSIDMCDGVVDAVEEWLPDELEYDGEDYQLGWNDVLQSIKEKLR
jgi:hypothetical protein